MIENKETYYPVSLTYYIDYGIIPYSRNIEKHKIIFKNGTNIIIPNYNFDSKDNETYFIYFRFNSTISKLNAKIIYENIIYLEDQTYIVLKPGINIIKFTKDIDHYLNITKMDKNKNKNSFYTIYKNEIIIDKKKINNTDNIIHIEEPSYQENIKLKIENEEEILLKLSSENFDDFSFISYDKTLVINQIENILKIKFNTTNFNSKIEYQIALINNQDNIEPISFHKIFQENELIYKNIIYSIGIEPIETNISLNTNNNFTYDKNYTIIALGKELIGVSLNYLYMEPKTLYIHDPERTIEIEVNEVKTRDIEENIDTTTIDSESIYNTEEKTEKNIIETKSIYNTEEKIEENIIEPTNYYLFL